MPGSPLTLDDAREYFFVAQRACERYASELKKFVTFLEQASPSDEWLEQVHLESSKTVQFHANQHATWTGIHEGIDQYVSSVRDLGEQMAIAELKGESVDDEADLPENRAKRVHPELLKFKLEKQARILGKGGVPALGAGLTLPVPPRDHILRATGSAAAVEIQYSKVENKDAQQLAGVFQFRQRKSDADASPWQQESAHQRARVSAAAVTDEQERQQQQAQILQAGGVGDLAAALQQRQALIQQQEAEQEAIKASEYRRRTSSSTGGDVGTSAAPELAAQLQKRQSQLQKQLAEEAAALQSASNSITRGPSTPAATFGNELAAVLLQREASKAAAEASAVVKSSTAGAGRGINTAGSGINSELAAALQRRTAKLQQPEEGGSQ